jgi:hypothetical protein
MHRKKIGRIIAVSMVILPFLFKFFFTEYAEIQEDALLAVRWG